jgi:hypothetical protein
MPLYLRRTISWIAVLACVMLAMLGLRSLPGWSGLREELQWSFAHAPRARELNRMSQLLVLADIRAPGVTSDYIAELLRSPDPTVVQHTLATVLNMGRTRSRLGREWLLEAIDWLDAAAPEARRRHARIANALIELMTAIPGLCPPDWAPPHVPEPATAPGAP